MKSPITTYAFVLPIVIIVLGVVYTVTTPLHQNDWIGLIFIFRLGVTITLASVISVIFSFLSFNRSDNGPEPIAYAMKDWMEARGIKTHYIKPSLPWEQPFVESYP